MCVTLKNISIYHVFTFASPSNTYSIPWSFESDTTFGSVFVIPVGQPGRVKI